MKNLQNNRGDRFTRRVNQNIHRTPTSRIDKKSCISLQNHHADISGVYSFRRVNNK